MMSEAAAPEARVEPHAVDRGVVRADGDLVLRGVHKLVALPEVVALRGLVKHVGDHACTLCAGRDKRAVDRNDESNRDEIPAG